MNLLKLENYLQRNIRVFRVFVLLGLTALIWLLLCVRTPAAELADDALLPVGIPEAATIVFCKEQIDTRVIVLYMEAAYADGTTVKFDGTHSHGFTDTTQLVHFLEQAKHFGKRVISCPLQGKDLSGTHS